MNTAFLGLGVMGYPMAAHLLSVSDAHAVFNRTDEKAARWGDEHGRACVRATVAEAVAEADVVFACLGNDDDVREICLGETGAFANMREGSVFVDHTTTSAEVARELHARAAAMSLAFVDAPVSGGQAGAENGQLTIMGGGDAAAWERVRPLLDCYAKQARLMGPSGAGQLTKMVNQICIAGLVQALSEGLHFAECAGLDGRAVVEVISRGAAQSWQMENRYETMLAREFDLGFAVDWMRKDLGIVLDEAGRNGASLPVTALVDQFYADVQKLGGRRWDTSSLIARLQGLGEKT